MFRHVVTAGVRHENGNRGVLCACDIPILFDARAPGAIVCLDEDGHRPRPPRAARDLGRRRRRRRRGRR